MKHQLVRFDTPDGRVVCVNLNYVRFIEAAADNPEHTWISVAGGGSTGMGGFRVNGRVNDIADLIDTISNNR